MRTALTKLTVQTMQMVSGQPVWAVYTQGTPDTLWRITHNLGRYPNVTTVDQTGNPIEGEVNNVSLNYMEITFSAPVAGTASMS